MKINLTALALAAGLLWGAAMLVVAGANLVFGWLYNAFARQR